MKRVGHTGGHLCLLFFFSLLMLSCQSRVASEKEELSLSVSRLDSLLRFEEHHYTLNANFEVKADSLLIEHLPVKGEFSTLRRGDAIVVAEFMTQPADSIDSLWVKVARDQYTQGWIRESELLPVVVPMNYISQLIYLFNDIYIIVSLIIIALFSLSFLARTIKRKKVRLDYFSRVDSLYPALLCVLISFLATLYASILKFNPDTWDVYYHNPTLNPFDLPFWLGVLIGTVWLVLVVLVAVFDDLFRQVPFLTSCYYLLGVFSTALIAYFFFVFTTPYYVGYFFLFLLLCAFVVLIVKRREFRYRCGGCNARMRAKGRCERCGRVNE